MVNSSRVSLGDAVLVPFPLTDLSDTKRRPAVVVSSYGDNSSRSEIVIMAITSQMQTPLGLNKAMVADWQSAGLIKASVLRSVFTTIERRLVVRVLGKVSASRHQDAA